MGRIHVKQVLRGQAPLSGGGVSVEFTHVEEDEGYATGSGGQHQLGCKAGVDGFLT